MGRDHRARFVTLLHDQILKLNQAELDFGLYRILNRRRTEIRKYLTESLPAILEQATSGAVEKQSRALETEVRELTEKLNRSAVDAGYEEGAFQEGELLKELSSGPNAVKYRQVRQQLDHLQAQQTLSGSELDQLYLHLLTFFNRYYQGGDFLTVPRRGRTRYLAPYSGEDTLFHWRSKGSHYVKTSTELRTYTYHPEAPGAGNPTTVRFELVEADTEQNNVKGDRRYFVPLPGQARHEGDTFILPFSYRPLRDAEAAKYTAKGKGKGRKATDEADEGDEAELSGTAQDRLLQDMLGSAKLDGVVAAELLKQANRYAKKNTSDYFVHPNLGPFLKSELDTYLLTEYLQPESLQTSEVMQDRFAKYRAMREAGGGLIDFLHQLEDFQAQLFEKRKFVLRADYLMPIRLVSEELWLTLLKSASQIEAWRDLFNLDLTGKSETEQMQILKEYPSLVVDTQHHDLKTKYSLLATYRNINDSLDGVLVRSENYAGLRTLSALYNDTVNILYTDPLYNTDSDNFLYKDEFSKDSTWLSMIEERIIASKSLLRKDSLVMFSIDDNEQSRLMLNMLDIFGKDNWIGTLSRRTKSGGGSASDFFAIEHDYIICFANNRNSLHKMAIPYSEDYFKRYSEEDEEGKYFWDTMERSSTQTRPYKIEAPDGTLLKGNWFKGQDTYRMEREKGHIRVTAKESGGWSVQFKQRPAKGAKLRSLLSEKEYRSDQGDLEEFGIVAENLYPKPVFMITNVLNNYDTEWKTSKIIMDYFAGSGTTAESVMRLNRRFGNTAKFLLMEMGEYFDSVTYQRIVKVMFAPDWKSGHPSPMPHYTALLGDLPDSVTRSPRLVQVLRLESFEDSLDALELPHERTEREKSMTSLFGDEYLVKYMLGDLAEGQTVMVATEQFKNPWEYHLRAGQAVDLPETFNLLLGLKISQVRELHHGDRRYLLVRGTQHSTVERMLVIWRDITTDFDPASEKTWLDAELTGLGWTWEDFDRIFVNADSTLSRAESLDGEFKRLMMVRDEAFRALSAGGTA